MRRDQGIDLVLRPELFRQLEKAAMENLENGGRGIGNQVENLVINPLSRWLFDHEIIGNASIVVEGFDTETNPPSVRCRKEGEEA